MPSLSAQAMLLGLLLLGRLLRSNRAPINLSHVSWWLAIIFCLLNSDVAFFCITTSG